MGDRARPSKGHESVLEGKFSRPDGSVNVARDVTYTVPTPTCVQMEAIVT